MREFGLAVAASVVLAALSLLVPSVPTTDSWGWIVWGREVMHLQLDTVAGPPSWKPLPVLVTAPLSLLGPAAPGAWLVVARAGGLLALWLAFRLAARFGGPVAGVIAAAALFLSEDWVRNMAHGFSEPLAVALALGAVECHLGARRTAALVLGTLVALARPEVWPLVVAYGVFVERRTWWVLALPPLLWVLPDWWGSGDPLHAFAVADVNRTRAGDTPALALLWRGLGLVPAPVWVAALAAAVLFEQGRVLAVAALAGFAGMILATALGYPGTVRFLVIPAALACVVAGPVAVRAVRRHKLALLAVVFAYPFVVAVPVQVRESVERAHLQQDLRRVVDLTRAEPGARAIVSGLWWNAGALAWELRVPLRDIGTVPDETLVRVPPPAVLFAPLGGRPPDDPRWRPVARVPGCVIARAGLWRAVTPC